MTVHMVASMREHTHTRLFRIFARDIFMSSGIIQINICSDTNRKYSFEVIF